MAVAAFDSALGELKKERLRLQDRTSFFWPLFLLSKFFRSQSKTFSPAKSKSKANHFFIPLPSPQLPHLTPPLSFNVLSPSPHHLRSVSGHRVVRGVGRPGPLSLKSPYPPSHPKKTSVFDVLGHRIPAPSLSNSILSLNQLSHTFPAFTTTPF